MAAYRFRTDSRCRLCTCSGIPYFSKNLCKTPSWRTDKFLFVHILLPVNQKTALLANGNCPRRVHSYFRLPHIKNLPFCSPHSKPHCTSLRSEKIGEYPVFTLCSLLCALTRPFLDKNVVNCNHHLGISFFSAYCFKQQKIRDFLSPPQSMCLFAF